MSCSLNPVMEEKPRKDVSEIPIKVELKKPEERIAFKMIRGMPIVTIKINNQGPYNFILDTGAGITVLSKEILSETKSIKMGISYLLEDATGKKKKSEILYIQSLTLDDAIFHDFIAIPLDLKILNESLCFKIDGIISIRMFYNLLFKLDYPNKKSPKISGSLE